MNASSYVFISYAREDQAYAHSLVNALRKRGIEVWIDERLAPGDPWWREIDRRICNCNAFVVVMTQASAESDWVQRETMLALSRNKLIFPLLLEGNEGFSMLVDIHYDDVSDGFLPPERFFERLKAPVGSIQITPGLRYDGFYTARNPRGYLEHLCFDQENQQVFLITSRSHVNSTRLARQFSRRDIHGHAFYTLSGTQIEFKLAYFDFGSRRLGVSRKEWADCQGTVGENSLRLNVKINFQWNGSGFPPSQESTVEYRFIAWPPSVHT